MPQPASSIIFQPGFPTRLGCLLWWGSITRVLISPENLEFHFGNHIRIYPWSEVKEIFIQQYEEGTYRGVTFIPTLLFIVFRNGKRETINLSRSQIWGWKDSSPPKAQIDAFIQALSTYHPILEKPIKSSWSYHFF